MRWEDIQIVEVLGATETGLKDKNGKDIHVGDKLRADMSYDVVVHANETGFYGKLVCDPDDSCANIPYHLNGGQMHRVLVVHDPPRGWDCPTCGKTHLGQSFANRPDGDKDLSNGIRWRLYVSGEITRDGFVRGDCPVLGVSGPLNLKLIRAFLSMVYKEIGTTPEQATLRDLVTDYVRKRDDMRRRLGAHPHPYYPQEVEGPAKKAAFEIAEYLAAEMGIKGE